MSTAPHLERRGSGVPLIAVHGNGVDHRLLLPLDPCFAEDGRWERIYLDLPGFGRTPALEGPGGLPELAEWLVGAVGRLVGEQRFALLANSLGGLLARHLVAHFGEQVIGLALLAPVVDPDPARRVLPPAAVRERDEALLAALPAADREEFTAITVRQTAGPWAAFRDHALPGIRAADPAAMAALAGHYALKAVPEVIAPPCHAPTVIVTGRQDAVVGFSDQFDLLAHYREATYAVLDRAGHNVHLEQPNAVAALLRGWARQALAHHG